MKTILEANKLNNEPHWYLAWLTNKVILGIWEKKPQIDFKLVLQLRIFNAKEELYIWRNGSDYQGRLVNTQWIQECSFTQKPFMWGICQKDTVLREPDLGLEIRLGSGVPPLKSLPLRYQVDNLYEYDKKSGNLVFTDARITNILDFQGMIISPEVENANI